MYNINGKLFCDREGDCAVKRIAFSMQNRVFAASVLLMDVTLTSPVTEQAGRIDASFYASVTAEYLTAALDSI